MINTPTLEPTSSNLKSATNECAADYDYVSKKILHNGVSNLNTISYHEITDYYNITLC